MGPWHPVPEARAQETQPPAAEAEEVRRAADEILSRPEFQEPARSLYRQALDWLGRLLDDVLGSLLAGGAGSLLAWVFILVVVGLLGYLLVRAVQRGARVRGDAASDADVILRDDRRPAEDWAADAERLEEEGRWREALRCRYRALVASLAGARVVEEVPGRTAGEYRVLVGRARPAVADPFAEATDLFEHAWYGNLGTGAAESAEFRTLAARVESGSAS